MDCRKCGRKIYYSEDEEFWIHVIGALDDREDIVDGRMCTADPKTRDSQVIRICETCGGLIHNVEDGDVIMNHEHGQWVHVNDFVRCFAGGRPGVAVPSLGNMTIEQVKCHHATNLCAKLKNKRIFESSEIQAKYNLLVYELIVKIKLFYNQSQEASIE